jgi:hypothetical protein
VADRDRDWDRPSDFADPHRLVMRCRAHTRPAIDTAIAEVIKIQGRYSPKDANAKSPYIRANTERDRNQTGACAIIGAAPNADHANRHRALERVRVSNAAVRRRACHPLLFFVINVLTMRDYGQTWDEPESYSAACLNVTIMKALVSGQPMPSWILHEWPGYAFVGASPSEMVGSR